MQKLNNKQMAQHEHVHVCCCLQIIPFEYHDGYLSVYFQNLTYYDVELIGLKLTPLQVSGWMVEVEVEVEVVEVVEVVVLVVLVVSMHMA